MLKVILALIVFVIAALLINRYYQASSMELLSSGIALKVKDKEETLPYQARTNSSFITSPLNIRRAELSSEQELLYYEEAMIDDMYEFNQLPEKIVRILFDAKESHKIFAINGLHAIQLVVEDGKVMNLIILQHDNKAMKLLYGLSNGTFAKVVDTLAGVKVESRGAAVKLEKPLINWSVEHINIDGIVSAIDH